MFRIGRYVVVSNARTDRFKDDPAWFDSSIVQHECTPREIIEEGIRNYLAGLSLSNTGILREEFGASHRRTAINDGVNRAICNLLAVNLPAPWGRPYTKPCNRRGI